MNIEQGMLNSEVKYNDPGYIKFFEIHELILTNFLAHYSLFLVQYCFPMFDIVFLSLFNIS